MLQAETAVYFEYLSVGYREPFGILYEGTKEEVLEKSLKELGKKAGVEAFPRYPDVKPCGAHTLIKMMGGMGEKYKAANPHPEHKGWSYPYGAIHELRGWSKELDTDFWNDYFDSQEKKWYIEYEKQKQEALEKAEWVIDEFYKRYQK